MESPTNPDATKSRDLLYSLNLKQHVTSPTHEHGHTLDLVITRSSESLVEDVQAQAAAMSDHNPLTFSMRVRRPDPVKRTITYRKLKNIDSVQFAEDLQTCSLVTQPAEDLDELVGQYNASLSSVMDKHAPAVTKIVTIKPATPWYTEALLNAKKRRRKAERKWLATGLVVHRDILRAERLTVNKLCAKAKADYYQGKISECAKDQKSLFKFADQLLCKDKDVSLPTHTNAEFLANSFAQFFTDKIAAIRESFPPPNINTDHPNEPTATMDSFQPIAMEKLKKLVLSGNSKCCSLDPIPTSLLKEHLDTLLPVIDQIVNKSISTGYFPSTLRIARVSPILKKPSLDKEVFKNYRPVSNLPYLGKLIERVAVQQLKEYRTENNLFEKCQSAYREFHSTETALLKITNDLLLAMDTKQCALLVLLDLSAAFDTVNHDILLECLEEDFGLSGTVLAWMHSYLSDREQAVVINGTSSDPQPLTVGLPQGSNVGPGEFPTYASPLFRIARNHGIQIHMYADDTQLYLAFNPQEFLAAKAQMEACLADMKDWMSKNHLKLNEDKTEFLVVGSKVAVNKISDPLNIEIGDATIEASDKARNIGVVMDCHLSMTSQVNSITKSCYVHLRNIARIRPNLTEDACATLVHAFVTSKLDNANSLLIGLPDKLIRKLQLIQNHAARIVTRSKKNDHVTPLLKRLHWLPIKSRIHYKVCLLTFKCLHGKAPAYLAEMLTPYEPTRTLRSGSQGLLTVPQSRLKTAGDRCFKVAAPRIWNTLPEDVRNCQELEAFKQSLKTHLFRLAYDC